MKNKFSIFLLIGFLTLFTLASPIMAHSGEDDFGHHSMMGGSWEGMNGMWIFGWIFMILIIVALVVFIVWMVKQIQRPNRR